MMNRISFRSVASGALMALLGGLCLAMTMGQGCISNGDGGGTVTSQFLGASECQLCHSRHYTDWLDTSHAGALNTLKAIGQDKNPDCIGCHTVGFGQEGGFVSEAATPNLAGVQCENCHGPGYEHRSNVTDPKARPTRSIAASVCGNCHNGAHHPTTDEWSSSRHALVTEDVAGDLAEGGTSTANCGICHSGDVRDAKFVQELDPVPPNLLAGKTREEMNGIVCVTCHDPHQRTENAVFSGPAKDYQLRFPETASPTQSNLIADATNPARFNLCGQCHHSRGRTWDATTRGEHHSVQVNMYIGEMPLPDNDQTPLVANTNSGHRFVPRQCVTCHMPTIEFTSDIEPADSGHDFAISLDGCAAVGCHPTQEIAQADMEVLQAQVQADLEDIYTRLGDPSTWEYTSSGGPADQSTVSNEIKKIRYLYYWVANDGSKGVHNPEYTRAILTNADIRLTALGR